MSNIANGQNGGARTAFLLVTDIHRSTQLWERLHDDFRPVLERHNGEVEASVSAHGGEIMKNLGDGYIAVFTGAEECLNCCVEVQQKVASFEPLPDGTRLLVRAVAHGGTLVPLAAGKGWFGQPINRASRICQVCHPGQTLVSEVVKTFIGAPPAPIKFIDLGEHRLRDLAEPEKLYQVAHPDFPVSEFEPLPTLAGYRPNNLTIQPNAFIGREKELAELKKIILGEKKRLVTIIAPGGYGKSRLAMQLCADMLDNYKNGVFAVLLAPVGDHSRIVGATADALGFQFYGGGDPKKQLLDYLREKEIFIQFDNFEHLMEAKPLVAEVLAYAPRVKIVVTSREPLRLSGEKIYPLVPLPVAIDRKAEACGGDGADDLPDAAALFIDRACLVSSDFETTKSNTALVCKICERLEGVPLSIELAAAWADSFTLPELLTELETQIELTARMVDVPERHRSIRASLDWSYNLLTDEHRAILRAVSCFRGGFYPDAGQAATGIKGLRMKLTELCDKSWLYAKEVGGKTRFYIRDAAAREYAFEKLKESDDYEQVAQSHLNYFSDLLKIEGERLKGHGQIEAIKTLGIEYENLLESLDTAAKRLLKEQLKVFAEHFTFFADMTSRWQDAKPALERVLSAARETGDAVLTGKVLTGIGMLVYRLGDLDSADTRFVEAGQLLDTTNDVSALANLIRWKGASEISRGNFNDAESHFRLSLKLAEDAGDFFAKASCLNNLGNIASSQANYADAELLYRESLEICREIGDKSGVANSLGNLGIGLCWQGKYADAERLHCESLEIFREIGDKRGVANSLGNLGLVASSQGKYADAERLYNESLDICREIGDKNGIGISLNNLGKFAISQGKYADAERLCNESLEIRRKIGNKSGAAYTLINLGGTAFAQGRYADAQKFYRESLEIFREIDDKTGIANTLGRLAATDIHIGKLADAKQKCAEAIAICVETLDFEVPFESVFPACVVLLEKAGNIADCAAVVTGTLKIAESSGRVIGPHARREFENALESAKSQLTDAECAAAVAKTENMDLKALLEFALAAVNAIEFPDGESGEPDGST